MITPPTTETPYSSLFSTIYNEESPVGCIGRGSHYSILRATTSYSEVLQLMHTVWIHDFAVIWDEDHDSRVIAVIEKLCIENLLSPVLFIGERKGGVTVLLDREFFDDKEKLHYFKITLRSICDSLNDPWGCEVGYFDSNTPDVTNEARMLINDSEEKVKTYLLNIENLWSLGVKHYPPKHENDLLYPK
ncbi:hypothetical protein RU080_17285 [Shewanella algae]|uniref:hypothetical protein n=1 Tax=Shewanella algae TaxID=38313 RepID=UPI0029355A5E|nr:hypothetical protein [Shewanella algae]MDV2963492.1 hypothetical protein [Shewanella algae]